MLRSIWILAAAIVLSLTPRAYATLSEEERACDKARYAAYGKWMGCFAKAMAGGGEIRDLAKCREKYARNWPRLQAKFPATSCGGDRFVDNGDGTVTDNLTKLVWEEKNGADGSINPANQHDVDNEYQWTFTAPPAAQGSLFTTFLSNLNSTGFAGQRDWRIPTVSELQSLLLAECPDSGFAPCVDPLLEPDANNDSWTNSILQPQPVASDIVIYVVNTSFIASVNSLSSGQSTHARAVRGGF